MIGFECKRQDSPSFTKSMHCVLQDLELTQLIVVYPGTKRYPIADKITVVPFDKIDDEITKLRNYRVLFPCILYFM